MNIENLREKNTAHFYTHTLADKKMFLLLSLSEWVKNKIWEMGGERIFLTLIWVGSLGDDDFVALTTTS